MSENKEKITEVEHLKEGDRVEVKHDHPECFLAAKQGVVQKCHDLEGIAYIEWDTPRGVRNGFPKDSEYVHYRWLNKLDKGEEQ